MTLIAILISLLADKALPKLQDFRQFEWFTVLTRRLRDATGSAGNGALGVLLATGLPTLAVGLLYYLLNELFWLLGLGFAVLALLFFLGPKNLDDQIQAYIDARESGNTDGAHHAATGILHEKIPASAFQLTRAITESILVQANERLLAILFWFAILGPFGASLYRLSTLLRNVAAKEHDGSEFAQAAARLHATLDWVPARLSALGYAIAGSFVDAVANWRSATRSWAGRWQESNIGVLLASGIGALQLDTESVREIEVQDEVAQVKSAQALVWRTLVVWVAIILIMTVAA
jgi:membrane protein required for beta-lactamase induction